MYSILYCIHCTLHCCAYIVSRGQLVIEFPSWPDSVSGQQKGNPSVISWIKLTQFILQNWKRILKTPNQTFQISRDVPIFKTIWIHASENYSQNTLRSQKKRNLWVNYFIKARHCIIVVINISIVLNKSSLTFRIRFLVWVSAIEPLESSLFMSVQYAALGNCQYEIKFQAYCCKRSWEKPKFNWKSL